MKRALEVTLATVAGILLGFLFVPEREKVVTVYSPPEVIEKVVEVPVEHVVERVRYVYVEAEPTPRPTDCVVMRWVE